MDTGGGGGRCQNSWVLIPALALLVSPSKVRQASSPSSANALHFPGGLSNPLCLRGDTNQYHLMFIVLLLATRHILSSWLMLPHLIPPKSLVVYLVVLLLPLFDR